MKVAIAIIMVFGLAVLFCLPNPLFSQDEEIRKPWYKVIENRIKENTELREFVSVRFKDNKITRSEYSDIMAESARLHQENAEVVEEQYKVEFKKILSAPNNPDK